MSEPDDLNSTEKPSKTKAEIDQSYSQCAIQLGDKDFKIRQCGHTIASLKSDQNKLRQQMDDLANEAGRLLSS
jgi:chromosome segregation ATPase